MRLSRRTIRALAVLVPICAAALPAGAVAQVGATWNQGTAAANSQWGAMAYGNGVFVAAAPFNPRVSYSADGVTWTAGPQGGVVATHQWQFASFAHDRFFVLGSKNDASDTGYMMTSADGVNWAAGTVPAGSSWRWVTYGNNRYVAISYGGNNEVMTSTNGVDWTVGTAPAVFLTSVTFGGGLFAAVNPIGAGGYVITSPDGITWTREAGAPTRDWRSITYGAGTFVAISADGSPSQIVTSTNGQTWTPRTTPGVIEWKRVTFGNGTFVAVGDGGAVMSSTDGITWTPDTVPVSVPVGQNWRAIAYGRGRFAALSVNGTGNLGAMYRGDIWTVPGAPTDVRGIARDEAAAVEWNPPASDGARPITGYRVTASPGGSTCTSTGASCTVTGLITGGTYTFRVTATNDQGTSAPSAASDPVVLPSPQPPTASTPASGAAAPVEVVPSVFARPSRAPVRVSFRRGRPGLEQAVAIDRPGSYTFAFVAARGGVTPMLSGSTVGARTLRTTTREVSLPGLRAGTSVRIRARIAPGAIAGARLRVSYVPSPESLLLPAG